MARIIPHYDYPKREIVKREIQNGTAMVVMVCKHAVPGKPISRYSKFFPCKICYEFVQQFKQQQKAG